MKTDVTKTYWKEDNVYKYNINDKLKMEITIIENKYNIPLNSLCSIANRKNPNRSFLFVSKVLGKHIPIDPWNGLVAGRIMAAKFMEDVYNIKYENEIKKLVNVFVNQSNCKEVYEKISKLPYKLLEPTIFIGFAETATGLAQSIFDSFKGKGFYTHTTREVISNANLNISFKEEHSHAKDHICYGLNKEMFKSNAPIVLIDDELTTGNTILNIIKALHSKYPRDKYIVLSILDWRDDEHIEKFKQVENELGISINVVSLVSGNIIIKKNSNKMLPKNKEEIALSIENSNVNIKYLNLHNYFDKPLQHVSVDIYGKESTTQYLKETGRFGLFSKEQKKLNNITEKIGKFLLLKRTGKNTLCLGTEEFIYIPMLISAHMGEGVKYHSTTRSPIYPFNKEGYGIKNAFSFESPSSIGVLNYIYNIPYGNYDDLFLFFESEIPPNKLNSLLEVLSGLGILNIFIVFCSKLKETFFTGSYKKEDVIFLLKNIGNVIEETGTEDREEAIQSGVHYSEMLPLEYKPTEQYINLFYKSLEQYANKVALAVAIVSEKIINKRGKDIVLVSLARAGTPIGILIKRYLKIKYNIDVPHYSISIIRGKGIDVNAINYILKYHPEKEIQFVDGWTGKGAITQVLIKACEKLKNNLEIDISPDLAVLADTAHCTATFGTREDFLIPSACLNATVSGLVSRTVHSDDLIGPKDFHGAKYYKEMQNEDVSNLFIDRITKEFPFIKDKLQKELEIHKGLSHKVTWKGLEDIKIIQQTFGIDDINLIKPGIGETTRVLLRRVPWKILVKDYKSDNLKHILLLAKDREVPIEEYPYMAYECCGLIKQL